ncbi:MAG: chorismate-binding protein [Luteolibacter sp.]|uniref:chorismate-binding protein n=1 Tax=Luteolibacter sp. TaxID=1962973 RepID=UPI00326547D0
MEKLNESMAWLAKQDGSLIVGHGPFVESSEPPADGTSFYVQDFALQDAKPWKTPSTVERTTIREMTMRFQNAASISCGWLPLDAAPFSVVFQEVMSSIHSGIFEKTVPVVTETGMADQPAGFAIMAAMTRQPLPLHSYGWIDGDSGFSGATPELLFALDGTCLETMALAGTARSDDREVFAVDEKEIREHEYVAQTLVSKLLDLGNIDRSAREILDLGSIVHFLTHIRLDLQSPRTPDELIRKLHPTPALGPLPRTAETLSLLFEWRNRLGCPKQFGAPFGLLDEGKFDAIVAIRGIWWEKNQVLLPAGCGVIEASRLVNEWRELRLKREAVKRFMLPL